MRTGELAFSGNTVLLQFFLGFSIVTAAALAILTFPAGQAAWMLAGLGLYALSIASPEAGIALAMVAIVLSPEIPVGGVAIRLEDVVLTAVIVGWATRRLAFREGWHSIPLIAPVAAYVAIGVIATAWGAILGTANITALEQASGASFHVLKRVEFALLFIVAASTLGATTTRLKRATYLLMTALIASGLYGLHHFSQTGWTAEAPRGAAGHEAGLGAMVLLALAMGILSGKPSGWARAFALASMGLAFVVIPLSYGRNFTLTATALLVIFAIFKRRSYLLLLPVAVLAGLSWFPGHIVERMLTLRWLFAADIGGAQTQGASILSRIQPPLHHGINTILGSPLVGFGLASIPLGFIDSEYVTQFYFTGALGFVIFVWFAVSIVRLVKQASRTPHGDPFAASFITGYSFVLAGYAMYSIFSPSISAARAGALFFLLTGMLAGLASTTERQQTSHPSAPHRRPPALRR